MMPAELRSSPDKETPVTLITGASTGIGAAMAEVFASHGHALVLVALEADLLDAVGERLRTTHRVQVFTLPLDLTAPDAWALLDTFLSKHGLVVDTLVNNAGLGLAGRFVASRLEAVERVVELNVSATVALTHRLLMGMVARGRGRVLITSSTAAFQPGPGMAVYFATKAFLTSFAQAIGFELEGTGVTVTAVHPGPTRSAFRERASLTHGRDLEQVASFADPLDVAKEAYAGLQRGTPMVITGFRNRVFTRLATLAPTRWVMRAVDRLHRQQPQ